MRLTKLKIAGFKSFVDPTVVTFPSSLTGVVGPNGCGKSNIIDAVRWVMGEISAKHLRGESMADVIFNGSVARKPLGSCSVELVFDNSEGKIGGPYASYNEVALRRSVSRDGTSDYFINGTKVRRKDITQLFLGTGLGTRSYAIIEQGMISRIIEARPDDLRAFLEEAAGISRYKERRRETESRIAQTRENLDRLNDLREEVDKQIRHLQRQAATARRYQALKEEERKLQAEVFALRLQSLDAEAGVRDAAAVHCDTAMQAALADLREAEARIEKIRVDQSAKADALRAIQERFYAAGGEVTRLEQSIEHAREMRERQRADLEQSQAQVTELAAVIERDRSQLEALAQELATAIPGLDAAHGEERAAALELERCEQALATWQQASDAHAQSVASGQRETQVERARIEQLDNQQHRLLQQRERHESERSALAQLEPTMAIEALAEQADRARDAGQKAAADLAQLLQELATARDQEREQSEALKALRSRWQQSLGLKVSTEALQQAALGKASGKITEWLKSKSLDQNPRVAQQLRVEHGWERAVETVLGSYLEAVCVDGLDSVTDLLGGFDGGHLVLVSAGAEVAADGGPTDAGRADVASLKSKVSGSLYLGSVLGSVFTAETLPEALRVRRSLGAGQSVVTRDGVWLGADWLRLSRDPEPHTGVIEREETLRALRAEVSRLETEVKNGEQELERRHEGVREREDRRERLQTEVNRLHREHVDRRAEHDSAQARRADAERRLSQLETGLADVTAELDRTEHGFASGACPHGDRHRCARSPRAATDRARKRTRAAARRADGGARRRAVDPAACTRAGAASGVAPHLARRARDHARAPRQAARRAIAAPRRT
jgi:chromosome segregation protein